MCLAFGDSLNDELLPLPKSGRDDCGSLACLCPLSLTTDTHSPYDFTSCNSAIDKRGILENYDLVTLCIDEIVDDGIILETDPLLVSSRVSHPPQQDINMKSIDFSEQGLLNAFEFGKRRLAEQLRQL